MHQFLKFIFGIKLYMFQTVPPSITKSLALYTQQWYRVCHIGYADCLLAVSITCMTYTYCCVYNARLLMMDGETVQNMQSFIPKINLRNWCILLVTSKQSA